MDGSILGPPANSAKAKPSSSDEKAPDSSDNTTSPRGVGWPKGKKRKKAAAKESFDPNKPLNAYNFFMKEKREKVRAENPTFTFTEITKRVAQDWRALSIEQKQQYTDAAELDKGRYAKEIAAYKRNDSLRNVARDCKRVKEEFPTDDGSGFTIPIFTEEFLDHNKVREAELRQLRKSNTDYEQQNAVLEKMIENTRTAKAKLEEETVQQRCHNQALMQHLEQMRSTLVEGFSQIPLPGEKEGPTLQTIDAYISKLHGLLESQSTTSPLYVRVREVVQRLDLHG